MQGGIWLTQPFTPLPGRLAGMLRDVYPSSPGTNQPGYVRDFELPAIHGKSGRACRRVLKDKQGKLFRVILDFYRDDSYNRDKIQV